jgi:hypothetical protein
MAFIIDESGNVCKGKDVGLYLDNAYFPADLDSGRIVIPFGRQKWTGKVLMVCDGFA